VDALFRDIKSVPYDYEPAQMDFKLSAHKAVLNVRKFRELTLLQKPVEP
jgi:hypothetical protein